MDGDVHQGGLLKPAGGFESTPSDEGSEAAGRLVSWAIGLLVVAFLAAALWVALDALSGGGAASVSAQINSLSS